MFTEKHDVAKEKCYENCVKNCGICNSSCAKECELHCNKAECKDQMCKHKLCYINTCKNYIANNTHKKFVGVLSHEFGHVLGLSDAYASATHNDKMHKVLHMLCMKTEQ